LRFGLGLRPRRVPLGDVRWVVIDCETSGLDPKRDRLLSFGAVLLRGGRIALADARSAVIRQAGPSAPENIVVHGIGGDTQLAGRPAEQALAELAAFAAEAVPAAFHAPFDAEILRRAFKAAGAPPLPRRWLDLAQLAPALFPEARRATALDDWLARAGVPPQGRHDALGDAFATAQLLLVLLEEAGRKGARTLGDVLSLAGSGRWLQ
jgi:DNA polymerase-3 subunit epsilon